MLAGPLASASLTLARPRAGPASARPPGRRDGREGGPKGSQGGREQQFQRRICNGISGLVVEYFVAIDVTRARFPADAFWARPAALKFDQPRQIKSKPCFATAQTHTSGTLPTQFQSTSHTLATHFPATSRSLLPPVSPLHTNML